MSSMMSVRKGMRKGVRNVDTSADAVGIESAGESLQLAYELHAQPRGLLIIARTLERIVVPTDIDRAR